MQELTYFFDEFINFIRFPFMSLGKTQVSIALLSEVVFSVFLITWIAKIAARLLQNNLTKRFNLEQHVAQTSAVFVRYFIVGLGLYVIIQNAGIDLSAFGILVGALGVGIGFGLQNITSNFISGIIILFERPIKPGDFVAIGQTQGTVIEISPRSTVISTRDNISIIVPNSDFINNKVINYSYTDRKIRVHIPVGVSYSSEPLKVRKILNEVGKAHPGVLQDMPVDTIFIGYGESSLDFELLVWTQDYTDNEPKLKSELYYSIFERLSQENIEIPFPHRHIIVPQEFRSWIAGLVNKSSN